MTRIDVGELGADRLGWTLRATLYRRAWESRDRRHSDAVVIQLGCGVDSRTLRLDPAAWFDVDRPEVTALRRQLYPERVRYTRAGRRAAETARRCSGRRRSAWERC